MGVFKIYRITKLFSSIRWRFIILYLVIVLVAFYTVTYVAAGIVESYLVSERVSERIKDAGDFAVSVTSDLMEQDAVSLYNSALDKGREISCRVVVTNEIGIVQTDSFSMLNGAKLTQNEIVAVLGTGMDSSYGFHEINDSSGTFWAGYFTVAIMSDGQKIGSVVLSQSMQDVVDIAAGLRMQYTMVFVISSAILLVVVYVLVNRVTKPIVMLKDAANSVAKGEFDHHVEVKGRSEIVELVNAFNYMTNRLENVDKQRSEFVSNASHELKTPLASMKILTESVLYQDGVEEEVYKEFLGDINNEIDRLTRLINDLLYMSRMEESEQLRLESLDLSELTDECVSSLKPIAQQKNIEIHEKLSNDCTVTADSARLRQAIYNVIENAIKYTGQGGGVYIVLSDYGGNIMLSVKDTGQGISARDCELIFDRFYRVDKARARDTGGTGLGLYIVRRIVTMHGGTIEVKSELGSGSEFIITLPVSKLSKTITSEELS